MDESLKQHLLLAREHYHKREYDAAEPHLNAVLKLHDGYADVHDMLGVIFHDRGDFQEARRHFEAALRINPSYTEAALNLAVTYNDLGLYSDARGVYEQMLRRTAASPRQIDPYARGKLANLHAEIAQAYADLGALAEATEEYNKALGLCPHFADLRVRLGNVLRDRGDLDGARREYEEALHHHPGFAPARVLLGVTLFSLGRRAEAEAAWEAAAKSDPQNKSAQMYLRMMRGNTLRSVPPPRPTVSDIEPIRLADSQPNIHAPPPDKLED